MEFDKVIRKPTQMNKEPQTDSSEEHSTSLKCCGSNIREDEQTNGTERGLEQSSYTIV